MTTLQGSPHEDPWRSELHACCGTSAKTKNSCIMLAFARPRVESKLTIHMRDREKEG